MIVIEYNVKSDIKGGLLYVAAKQTRMVTGINSVYR
jgi:hypothetical protein